MTVKRWYQRGASKQQEAQRPEFLDKDAMDSASMKSLDQEVGEAGEVVDAVRKKFEVEQVPPEIAIMESDELQPEKNNLKGQVEAAKQVILVRKKDEYELLD